MNTGKKIAIIISSIVGALVLFVLVSIFYIGPHYASMSKPADNSPQMDAREWIKLDSKQQTKIVQDELNAIKYSGPIKADHISTSLMNGFNILYPTSEYSIGISVDYELSKERLASVEDKIKQKTDGEKVARLQQLLKTAPPLSDADQESVKSEINDLNKSIADAKAKQEKAANAPLKIINSFVDKDSIGTPQAHVVVRNVGNKTIDAYKVSIACFDSFGDPVSDEMSNEYDGISEDITVAPGETAGESKYWLLALQETTTKIIPVITEVHFTDGTTWSNDN